MGRHRGTKFSFPIPGRKSSSKGDKSYEDLTKIPSVPSITSVPSASDRSYRYNEPPNLSSSKAERLLGTAPPPFRAMTGQSSVPPSPGYLSVTTQSETGSSYDDHAHSNSTFRLPKPPTLSRRASSNIIPSNIPYTGDGTEGSTYSSTSRQLHPATSNSTLRSHYDAKNSPLYISQQTSDSAVRDMALRKGQPQIGLRDHDLVPNPLAQEIGDPHGTEHRKGKPAKLDLSKLFPKPRGHGGQDYGGNLLSPNKLVNSPTAMSAVSEYFPRPMTREPTPQPKVHAKLTKPQRHQPPPAKSGRPTSPVRLHKRDEYDSAKINVRRPPRGIQHWFEALSEDSDELEDDDDEQGPMRATPVDHARHYPTARDNSQNTLFPETTASHHYHSRTPHHLPEPRMPRHFHANQTSMHRLNAPSTHSLQSESSRGTTRTKGSVFSKSNLQDSSILSFSSSEDEGDNNRSRDPGRKVPFRDSIESESGDIIIGQAQAFEVRPPLHSRRPSAGKLSLLSTSTTAATIDIMYTPEPPYTPIPRNSVSSKRTSHARQPSVIHEVEDSRPKTAQRAQSPSARSTRTSKSEPRSQDEVRKFMAVTPEEEALLEALRKKRAAMAQQGLSKGHETATKQEEVRRTPPEKSLKKDHRMSGFLVAETPAASPVRIVETKRKAGRRSLAPDSLPLPAPHRGRPTATQDIYIGSSVLRDSSSCDPNSERDLPTSGRYLTKPILSPQEFSPLDLFPSPGVTPTASVASPATTDLPSPLPSPVTPRGRQGDDVDVKVASSVPSWNGDTEDITVLETGVIDPPAGSIKPEETQANHQRRRTASSGAEVPFALPAKHQPRGGDSRALTPVTELSYRPTITTDSLDLFPTVPKKSNLRNPSLSINTTGLSSSRYNNIMSTRTSSPNRSDNSERRARHTSRVSSLASTNSMVNIKRDSVAVGTASTRCSVSEDVLAAWGSLGGMRD